MVAVWTGFQQEEAMTRYLVVAHQTAAGPELIRRARELAREDPEAAFSILVPATPVDHMLAWEEGETDGIARRRAEEARRVFEDNGLKVRGIGIGDASPILAAEDALREQPGEYDAIILSTLPPSISRWIKLDNYSQAERRFNLPVIRVVAEERQA